MTPLEQAEAILKAAEEATPEPWAIVQYGDGDSLVIHSDDEHRVCFMATPGSSPNEMPHIEANAAFIALARNTAPAIALALIEKHKALEEACDLFRSICAAYENQDLSHVQFRVKCAEFAQAFLARQGETA